ncbi:plasmid mobilization relaxosome protein MobC [Clavibacter michiganensis]|uniref:plasmid mobilization relaxosome protein MobC n=1 Tax=Clavibacter michiganensis TaxID=28447 RepID=UPI0026DA74C5|nr:plasmid mobilization relaxosome protein MobC [Clavibacter michiganensis]MDO4039321.1 plasmid mobilization relaxosome protein MobC [Clavibacter michiganensis]MDO4063958.1 plasmid mobilization relaxosome protein MobC [Clavibacter michiganensis]MDO4110183.1 plasmid mobilization relaxosome protein MobC [Clavibacter michiganensis]MDO4113361.1 plasmid mobilization relaxosome protein MobC [Clavibacter michiganensis]MDO4116697.1 plasmid mobilization relaxosome protein MobC [Clavibacter michiganensi
MKLTDEEEVQLASRAAVRDVTVPRLLVEAAMSERVVIEAEWKTVVADLFDLRSKMGYTANNMNQLAKFANTEGRFPDEADAVMAEFRALIPRISAAVERVAEL